MKNDGTYTFPENFVWGTATSAYQTEGNNIHSDWWQWETGIEHGRDYYLEPSGIACDSYHRYEEDFDLCVKLNNDAVRISIEWARIEPVEGRFSQKEIDHYKRVLRAAKERNLKTFVTLHHFTNPIWFMENGGWTKFKSAFYFERYAKKCADSFGNLIDYYLTINEPQVYSTMSYLVGKWPPNKANIFSFLLVQINMMRAHRKAYDAIKSVDKTLRVGMVEHIVWYEGDTDAFDPIGDLISKVMYWFSCDFFLNPIRNKLDLIGVNYYFTNILKQISKHNPDAFVSDLGWSMYPEGLEKVLINLKRYNLPLYITENGLADAKDKKREEFLKTMLIGCAKAIKKGSPVRGYFYWSLIDNYEWNHGFWPRFGLVEIDYDHNLKRTPRKSFYTYAKICKEGKIEW